MTGALQSSKLSGYYTKWLICSVSSGLEKKKTEKKNVSMSDCREHLPLATQQTLRSYDFFSQRAL